MRFWSRVFFKRVPIALGLTALGLIPFGLITGCAGDPNAQLLESLSGRVVISSVLTGPATGPGTIVSYDSEGKDPVVLRDYFSSGTNYASGLAIAGNGILALFREGPKILEKLDLTKGTSTTYSNVNVTATPVRHIAADTQGAIYIAESNVNTVEKIDANDNRVGNPYINTTTGSCVLASPWGVAVNTTNDQVAVISSANAGRLSIYDSAGSCLFQRTGAPFNTGTPTAICYHKLTNRFIVTFATTHAIFSVSADGSTGTQIYLNASIINTPRAVACGDDGAIYVGSDGTDTVEKLFYSGTGLATRVLSGPFAGPNVYTQNPTGIVVFQ
jgi:hypothetical protein